MIDLKNYMRTCLLALTVTLSATACFAQQAEHQHDPKNHDKHQSEVNERGDKAMGFSHKKNTHRFRLLTDGGAIEVRANRADDKESLQQIRKHLREIAEAFPAGEFDAPFSTHGKIPPGVPAMKRLGKEINYEFDEIEGGGRVRLSTNNADALRAIHDFMRFQIEDHQTGDSTKIEKP